MLSACRQRTRPSDTGQGFVSVALGETLGSLRSRLDGPKTTLLLGELLLDRLDERWVLGRHGRGKATDDLALS